MISFLQCGFSAVRHERSFACTRGGAQPAEAPPPVTKGKVAPAGAKVHAGRPLARATVKKTPNPSVCVERTDAGGPAKVAASVLAEIRCLADRGALDEALRACERFLEEEEPEREAFYLMGLIHLARNSFAEAETFFQKALYMDPQYYDALVHMELLYEQKGDRGQASLMKQRIERARNSAVERQEGP
jgi:chemotaxis protein methyltransferase WspC